MKRQPPRTNPPPMALLNTLNERGNALLAAGKASEAIACYRQAIALAPKLAPLYFNLGKALKAADQFEEAETAFRQAMTLDPRDADTPYMLGNLMHERGRLKEAAECYRRAIALKPNFHLAIGNLGETLRLLGSYTEAKNCLELALSIAPDDAKLNVGLAMVLSTEWSYRQAESHLGITQKSAPEAAYIYNSLADIRLIEGRFDEAVSLYRKALDCALNYREKIGCYGNILFALNYHPYIDANKIYSYYQEFGQKLAGFRRWYDWPNDKNPERRLRIGYVSPDFRQHSTRYFLEPLLAAHDKSAVEIHAYSEVKVEDNVTERYRLLVDHYIRTVGMSDDALAERIHADGIDLLVDLAGATADHRLGVFARKPAPVSVSWLGFGYTTGLPAIDYFLGDEIMTPPGCEALFAEQVFRIPAPCFVFRSEPAMQCYEGLPALDNGYVTFATLSRSVRLNERVIKAWAAILHRVEGARLIIDAGDFRDPATINAMQARFTAQGITPERLSIGYHSPPWELLCLMVDIGLDCFPHNSGTTLFEMAHLGIPFITLADRPSVGRIGSTIAHGLGHPEWIAQSEEEYIAKAVALASDLERLARLRVGLRSEMERSPLMDEKGFARKVEAAYREMWRRWCAAA